MRIAWDIKEAAGEKAGKGYYTFRLLDYFIKNDRKNEYFLFSGDECLSFDLPPNFHLIKTPRLFLFRYIWQAIELRRRKIDILFSSTSYVLPTIAHCKVVLIIYDFAVYHPFTKPAFKTQLVERLTLKKALKKAIRVAAISESTKREMQKLFVVPDEKIDVVYAGVDKGIEVSPKEIGRSLTKLKIKKKFILFVGTIEPRKNVKNLIGAYGMLSEKIREEYELILVGKKGWNTKEIYKAAEKLPGQVRFMGYLTERELASLYKKTSLFVYPSLYEGFGLPILEAMRYGAPVITSNTTSMPEVAGNAAVIVNPWHIEEIAAAMMKLINNPVLKERLIIKGFERIRQFSWDDCAEKVLASINKANRKNLPNY
jgi:glycosyltransferase involved in cell wall biosynthesis